ncbi:MAG: alpha/beta fold hydrolase [Lysobacterales bacterium]|jgi:alpha-beta hydrolase superfamily lysophospholipase
MHRSRLVVLVALGWCLSGSPVMSQSFDLVRFDTQDGGSIEAAWFAACKNKAVIFAHGAIYDKESWYFLAQALQEQGVSALAIDFRGYGDSKAGNSLRKMYDILGAVAWLEKQGLEDISIVGASMGGAAVLTALAQEPVPISKVVLLAPAGGPALASASIDKLFVVSRDEDLYNRVMAIYEASVEPKTIKVYPGSAHAQHLFDTAERDDLIARITGFIGSGS